MIRFGPWSTTLGLGALFALAVAAALLADAGQRRANRWVAALLAVMALKLTPYVIGYAGFYDAWPWLSFAPSITSWPWARCCGCMCSSARA